MLGRYNPPGPLNLMAARIAKFTSARILLPAAVGCIGAYYFRRAIVKAFFRGWCSGAIGPYPTSCNDPRNLLSYLNRWLINVTRKTLRMDLYPAEALLELNPSRNGDNGHPISGSVRDAARLTIQSVVTSSGHDKFEFSPARQSRTERSAHQHYAVADLDRMSSADSIHQKHIVTGIDVDYYAVDPSVLLGHLNPTLFYTFNPVAVAGADGECRFTIRDNVVEYVVPGGGRWCHSVWDWCAAGEFLEVPLCYSVLHRIARLIGLRQIVYHKVAHFRPWPNAPHRALIMTIPQSTVWMFPSLPHDMHARKLERVKYADEAKPGWNRMIIPRDGRFLVNFGRMGEQATAEIPLGTFEELMGTKNNQSVTTRMVSLGINDMHTRMLVNQYHAGVTSNPATLAEIMRPIKPIVHWPVAITADVKPPSYRQYAAPLVSDCNMVPLIKRWEALSVSIDTRVTYVKNATQPPLWMAGMADRWVRMLVPEAGLGVPLSYEQAREELDKPSQILAVSQIWDTLDVESKTYIEAFLKNEACMKPARIISSYSDAKYLLSISRFTIAFRKKVLANSVNQHWFMPGKTPVELADCVCDYVKKVGEPMEGDYANLDGTVSEWIQRNVMLAPYFRYYAPEYHDELRRDTNPLVRNPARAKSFGFAYDAGPGVKSGGANTCDGNCMLLCFLMFVSILKTCPQVTDEEAWLLLGLCFGDDSLFDEMFGHWFKKLSRMLGLNLKIETYDKANGVCFLSRVFPDPETTTTSFQDPLRTWRKLHITARDPNVDLNDAAMDRCTGYSVIDSLTPVTSNYVNMVIRHVAPLTTANRLLRKDANREKPYWSYSTFENSWPQKMEDISLMRKVIAHRTSTTEATLLALEAKLDACGDIWSDSITIDRDEFDLPYKQTVLPDGTITADVDPVEVENERQRIESRNPAGITRESRADVDAGNEQATTSGTGGNRRSRGTGSTRISGIPTRNIQQNGTRNNQSSRQATRGQGPPGRTATGTTNNNIGRGAARNTRGNNGRGRSATTNRRSGDGGATNPSGSSGVQPIS
jgi:hypothetical protein